MLALILFVALFAAGLFTVLEHSGSGLNRVVTGLESWVLVSAAMVYIVLEGSEVVVIAARYRQLLKEEGRREGQAEGRRQQQDRWVAWERGRQQAQDEGREPPPAPDVS